MTSKTNVSTSATARKTKQVRLTAVEAVPDQAAPATYRKKRVMTAAEAFEGASRQPDTRYVLRLYVAGLTARSAAAISNLKAICEEHLKGNYELDVVDIYQQPSLARRAQITAAPTLIRRLPMPLRRIVGDMSRKDRVLVGLDLMSKD